MSTTHTTATDAVTINGVSTDRRSEPTGVGVDLSVAAAPRRRRTRLWIAVGAAAVVVAGVGALMAVRAGSSGADAASSTGGTVSSATIDRTESAHGTAGGVRTGAGAPVAPAAHGTVPVARDLDEVMHGSALRLVSGTGHVEPGTRSGAPTGATSTAQTDVATRSTTARGEDPAAHGTTGRIALS